MAKTTKTPARKPASAKTKAATGPITIPPAVDDELGQLWDAFKGSASDEARERLILHYAPLVKYVASRVATGLPASVEQADLVFVIGGNPASNDSTICLTSLGSSASRSRLPRTCHSTRPS